MKLLDVQVVAPSAVAIITVEEFTDHARLNGITVGAQPDLVAREIAAATSRAEQYLRRSLLEQTLKALFTPVASDPLPLLLVLPRGPVKSVTSVSSGGAAVGFQTAWNFVTLAAPLDQAAEVLYVSAGFGVDATNVPQPVREGILEYATTLYEDRTGAREAKHEANAGRVIPAGVQDLWRPYQIELSG